jgi:threonine/homoserine/homoserine lactone efflux protein
MILKGLKFGMLLQLSIGPMCLMVFQTSSSNGFLNSLNLVLAIALIDAFYIGLSGIGIATVLRKEGIQTGMKIFGCLILILFGVNTLSGSFDIAILPKIALFSNVSSRNLFFQGLLLTASNPLTILFWSGMFTTQVLENRWNKKQLVEFAAGCVLSTLSFLTCISILGSILGRFLPHFVIQILNGIVGSFLIFFGIKMLLKKSKAEKM